MRVFHAGKKKRIPKTKDSLADRGEFELTGDFVSGCLRQYRAICQAAIMLRSCGLADLALNGAAACDKGTGAVICEFLGWSPSFACEPSASI